MYDMTQTHADSGDEEFLLVPAVAERLKQDDHWVRRALARRELVGYFFGGKWHVYPSDVDKYLKAKRNVAEVRRRSA